MKLDVFAIFVCMPQVEFLLERGVDPDARVEGNNETALLVAARRGQRLHLRVAAALIRAGANLLARDVSLVHFLRGLCPAQVRFRCISNEAHCLCSIRSQVVGPI